MALSSDEIPQIDDLNAELSCDDLFIRLYRCAMSGLSFGDTAAWRFGQRLLARHVPAQDVGALFGQFYGFSRAVIAASQAAPACRPVSFRGISAEETLALRMIEMSQRGDSAGMASAGAALVADGDLGAVMQSAQSLARALAACGLFVGGPGVVEPDRERRLRKR